MFRKNHEPEEEQVREAPGYTSNIQVRKRGVSVIGPTLIFKGELTANEDLVIEGQIEGTIAHQDKNLTVGKKGRVTADIHAQLVEVLGEVNGNIRADKLVTLRSTAVVNGNIVCSRIVMEDGACFCGNVKMERVTEPQPKAKLKVAENTDAVPNMGHGAA